MLSWGFEVIDGPVLSCYCCQFCILYYFHPKILTSCCMCALTSSQYHCSNKSSKEKRHVNWGTRSHLVVCCCRFPLKLAIWSAEWHSPCVHRRFLLSTFLRPTWYEGFWSMCCFVLLLGIPWEAVNNHTLIKSKFCHLELEIIYSLQLSPRVFK